jgi:polyketide biosynthesis 3-hydroxy-3-methylglutaryl-CoA synthase-like enzyme PksG
MFSATIFLALCSLIDTGQVTSAQRVGLFSYGSGCTSEFYSGVITERARPELERVGIGHALAARRPLSLPEYDILNDLAVGRVFGVRDHVFDPAPYADLYASQMEGRERLVLDRIENYHRRYRWS